MSSARQDAAMQAMTTELNNRRGSDELAFIADECGQAAESRMICYAQCVKLRKKRENERFFHRNNAVIVHIAIYHFSRNLEKLSVFKKVHLVVISKDKQTIVQWFLYLTGFTQTTTLEIVEMPICNFDVLIDKQIARQGIAEKLRRKIAQSPDLDTNFDFGVFGFCKPETNKEDCVTSMRHHELGFEARLPNCMSIPVPMVGDHGFKLTRWASAETCTVKGPAGFSFLVKKIFTEEQQEEITKHQINIKTVISDNDDMEIATRPDPTRPDMTPQLRGKNPRTTYSTMVAANNQEEHGSPLAIGQLSAESYEVTPDGKKVPVLHLLPDMARVNADQEAERGLVMGLAARAAERRAKRSQRQSHEEELGSSDEEVGRIIRGQKAEDGKQDEKDACDKEISRSDGEAEDDDVKPLVFSPSLWKSSKRLEKKTSEEDAKSPKKAEGLEEGDDEGDDENFKTPAKPVRVGKKKVPAVIDETLSKLGQKATDEDFADVEDPAAVKTVTAEVTERGEVW